LFGGAIIFGSMSLEEMPTFNKGFLSANLNLAELDARAQE
jgi:hypothetical protein